MLRPVLTSKGQFGPPVGDEKVYDNFLDSDDPTADEVLFVNCTQVK